MQRSRRTLKFALVWVALLGALLPFGVVHAQDVGETVNRQGRIGENWYAAGGNIRLREAQVTGDVVAAGGVVDLESDVSGNSIVAGGQVRLVQRVKGDLLAVAGSLEVRGDFSDDARLAGGEVTVYARVAGDLIAAGGRVTVGPGTHVTGRTALAGGMVAINGTIDKRLHAIGRTVFINGVVNGDAEIDAQQLILGPTARINGALTYRSPNEARVESGAQVAGKMEHLASPISNRMERIHWFVRFALVAGLALTVFVLGAAWFGLFPGFSRMAPATLRASPLRSLLAGILVVVGAPLATMGLSIVVVGLPLALLLSLIYPPVLLLGLVTAVFCVGDAVLLRLRGDATTGRRLLALLVLSILLGLLMLVPIVGWLVMLAAIVLGTGAFWLRLLRADAGR